MLTALLGGADVKIFRIVFLLLAVLILTSCTQINSIENAPIAEFSYEDWVVLGAYSLPGRARDRLGRANYSMSASRMDGSSSFCSFGFGTIGGSLTWDLERGINILTRGVVVDEITQRITLPRGIGVGTSLYDVMRIYRLIEEDENGYFYGGGGIYPSARKELRYAWGRKYDTILFLIEHTQLERGEIERFYTLRYYFRDGYVVRIAAHSESHTRRRN